MYQIGTTCRSYYLKTPNGGRRWRSPVVWVSFVEFPAATIAESKNLATGLCELTMILRIILVSLRNLLRQPFRTVLILQGVIWGTAIGVVPPAIINGSLRRVEEQASRLGTDRILLTQDHVEAPSRFDWDFVGRLRVDYADTLRQATGLALHREAGAPLAMIATDEHALAARGMRLAAGRFLDRSDVEQARPVCVLEHGAAAALFGEDTAIGRTVKIADGRELAVVGVTASRADEGELLDELGYQLDHPMRKLVDEMKRYVGVFNDEELKELAGDRAVLVPHTLLPDARPRWIEIRAEPRDVLGLRDRLQNRLSAAGYEPVIYVNAILPVLFGETIKTARELHRAVFVLAICVGTSIVCAIMVLSVVERQREIAIRRVEGARRWHIALQFVVETGTVCAVGAVLGVPLGIGIAIIRCALEPLGSVTWTFPGVEVCVLFVVVTAIGLTGGLLPAWRAMRVDPVEMLRYE